MRNKNPTCGTSVTTPTGTFTYFKKEVTVCQAKIECSKRGQILAPLTNWGDLDALRSIASTSEPSCKFHYGFRKYHVGLDVSKCDNRIHRLFSNNVLYNKTLHGDLYRWHGNKSRDTNSASFSPSFRKVFIIDHIDKHDTQRFICLKPNTTVPTPESLIDKNITHNPSSNLLFACAAFMVAFVGIMLLVNSKKQKTKDNEEVIQLRSQVESFKNEAIYYKEEYEKLLKRIPLE